MHSPFSHARLLTASPPPVRVYPRGGGPLFNVLMWSFLIVGDLEWAVIPPLYLYYVLNKLKTFGVSAPIHPIGLRIRIIISISSSTPKNHPLFFQSEDLFGNRRPGIRRRVILVFSLVFSFPSVRDASYSFFFRVSLPLHLFPPSID